MRRIRNLAPSPAMVVACIALAIALGGTSYAAITLPRNSVGTKQLKTNAVTSPKVKDNSLTGADILESRLGRVPSASVATTATNATNATNATSATNAAHATTADSVAKTIHTGLIKATTGQVASVATFGPFTVTFKCNDLGSNNFQIQWIIATTELNSAFGGSGVNSGDFGPATPEASRIFATNSGTTPNYRSAYSVDLSVAAPSGAWLNATLSDGVHTLGAACVGSLDAFTS